MFTRMLKRLTPLAALVPAALFFAGCSEQALPTEAVETSSASVSANASGVGQYMIVFKRNAVPADLKASVEALGGKVEVEIPQVGVAFVSGVSGNGLSKLQKLADVQGVEPEVVLSLVKPVSVSRLAEANLQSPQDPATSLWHDLQWNMLQIGADQAWDAGRLGSSAVTVGIIDSGLDYTHYDLAGRVDLARSRSFVPAEDSVLAQYLPGLHPVFDLNGHGTHVGATVSSNAVVAAGVTSQVTLMGLKVCGSGIEGLTEGGCPTSGVFAALVYAADNGADVVNMSLGGLFTKAGANGYVSVINRIFSYMQSKNVTVVVSAGNDAADLKRSLVPVPVEEGSDEYVIRRFPSLYATYCDAPNVICVSATGPADAEDFYFGPWEEIDAPAVYTNFGAITVAAPGGNTGGYVWAACPRQWIVKTGETFSGQVDAYCNGGTPIGLAGTSMASPHVAGLAALLVEQHGKNPKAITAAIRKSADDLGKPGMDDYYGKGRINVARALGL